MSVVASLIAANLKGTYDVFSILPILLMVTELDFAHALLVMTVKSLSSKDSVPLCIRANMKILSRRALITSALDLACITLVLLGSSQYESHHHALTFTLKIGFISVLFNFALFLTLLPAIITLIAYYFPRRALMAISSDNEMEHLAARASTTLKVGAGFEVFALISATFVLGQSRLLVGRLARRLLPDPMLIILGDVIAYLPFDFTTSIHSTGVKTLMLVSLFRYLVLENVRSHRSRRITLDKPKLKPKKEETVELEEDSDDAPDETSLIRPIDELLEMMKNGNMERLTINECCALVEQGHIRPHMLEKALGDARRGVYVRRKLLDSPVMRHIRADNYDYSVATKTCCENVIGYLQMPLGQIGPLRVDEVDCRPILATTEGALVASVNRGCKLLTKSGGVKTHILKDAMSRAPCLMFDTVAELHAAVKWIESNGDVLKEHFESTTRFGRLQSVTPFAVGRYLYVRCSASTGDAMGMNMVSKGTEKVVEAIKHHFPQCRCISLSGNACTDKKPSAMNWIEGRGKSIIAECTIPETDLKAILKVSAADLEALNTRKNLIGSSVAGSIGGFNAHAANIVAACFLATGQDPAQVVEGSQTMTLLERVVDENGKVGLHASVTMKSLEVAARGGGTALQPQAAIGWLFSS